MGHRCCYIRYCGNLGRHHSNPSLGVFTLLSVNGGTSGESSLQQLINNTAAEGRAEALPDSSAAKQAQHFCFVGKKSNHQEDKIYQIKQEIFQPNYITTCLVLSF
ncbi:hypothetical protein NQZ68_016263 [Dissostichus eleginoides]|nr:hypothetical protein NQZ68_016263 [Dissostichus eleginoides]